MQTGDCFMDSGLFKAPLLSNVMDKHCMADELEQQVRELEAVSRDASGGWGNEDTFDDLFCTSSMASLYSSFGVHAGGFFEPASDSLDDSVFGELELTKHPLLGAPLEQLAPRVPLATAKRNWTCLSSRGMPLQPGAWIGCSRSPWCNLQNFHVGFCTRNATIPGLAAYGAQAERMNEVDAAGVTLDDVDVGLHAGGEDESSGAGSGKHGGMPAPHADEAENNSPWVADKHMPAGAGLVPLDADGRRTSGLTGNMSGSKSGCMDVQHSYSLGNIHNSLQQAQPDSSMVAHSRPAPAMPLDGADLHVHWMQTHVAPTQPMPGMYPGAPVDILETADNHGACGAPYPVNGGSMCMPGMQMMPQMPMQHAPHQHMMPPQQQAGNQYPMQHHQSQIGQHLGQPVTAAGHAAAELLPLDSPFSSSSAATSLSHGHMAPPPRCASTTTWADSFSGLEPDSPSALPCMQPMSTRSENKPAVQMVVPATGAPPAVNVGRSSGGLASGPFPETPGMLSSAVPLAQPLGSDDFNTSFCMDELVSSPSAQMAGDGQQQSAPATGTAAGAQRQAAYDSTIPAERKRYSANPGGNGPAAIAASANAPSSATGAGSAPQRHVQPPRSTKKRAAPATGTTCSKPAPNPNGHACTQCGTQTTPVWRAGPYGPKTLCNACGVRYMKVAKKK